MEVDGPGDGDDGGSVGDADAEGSDGDMGVA